MIREFKALTGVTPGVYVRSKQPHNDPTLRSVTAEHIMPPAFAENDKGRRSPSGPS